MATYRESQQPLNRGRSFFSPLCAPVGASTTLSDAPINEQSALAFSPLKKEISSEGMISAPTAFEPIPDAKRDFDWSSFPTYSEMLHRRVYIPGQQIIETEVGYSPDLLKFREEKAEEYALGAAIEVADYSQKRNQVKTIVQ